MTIQRGSQGLRLNDWFCGAGGATQGAHAVPGIVPVLAANHDQLAIETHSTNFPDVEHFRGDIRDLDVAGHPYAEIFWASPECTNWSQAKGKPVDYDKAPALFGDPEVAEDVQRSRALMQDVIRYLEGMTVRQQPVLAGVVENVTDIRKWNLWHAWLGRIHGLGYRTRLIALNSMHAQPRRTPFAPQSRDRLYLAYWHNSLGRNPDWDRWLRPLAYCPSCGTDVAAVQHWKRAGQDMGRYRQQYLYRCPTVSCRGREIEPYFVPAAAAIDWSLPGTRIGDRSKPLAAKTRARIAAGIARYWRPLHIEAAGHTYDAADPKHPQHGDPSAYYRAWPADTEAIKTIHTLESKALVVPVEGRDGKHAQPAGQVLRTQTARNESGVATPFLTQHRFEYRTLPITEPAPTMSASGNHLGVVQPPFVAELRGGGSDARPASEAMATVTASGNHHGLVVPSGGTWNDDARPAGEPLRTLTTRDAYGLVAPYYGTADTAQPSSRPLGALTTRDRYALVMRQNGTKGDVSWASTPVQEPLRTLTTKGQQALLTPGDLAAAAQMVDDAYFRMFEPAEIHAGMAFTPTYRVLGSKRQKVKQLGNAVTPPVAEVLVAALVECIQGHDLDWSNDAR